MSLECKKKAFGMSLRIFQSKAVEIATKGMRERNAHSKSVWMKEMLFGLIWTIFIPVSRVQTRFRNL